MCIRDSAYTPDRRAGMRPDYPSIVYTKILKEIYPDVPVVLGGIEASLRRVTHYDYWQDKLLPGILKDSPADLLIYGMGELPLKELVSRLQAGTPFHEIKDIRLSLIHISIIGVTYGVLSFPTPSNVNVQLS